MLPDGFLYCIPIEWNSYDSFARPVQHSSWAVGGPHSSLRVRWERRVGVGSQGPWGSTALLDAVYAVVL